jgi:hypothetical protein
VTGGSIPYKVYCEQVVGGDKDKLKVKLNYYPIEHNMELLSITKGLLVKVQYLQDKRQTRIRVSSTDDSFCNNFADRINAVYVFLTRFGSNFIVKPDLSRPTSIEVIGNKTGYKDVPLKASLEAHPADRNVLIEAFWYTMTCNDEQLRLFKRLFESVYAKTGVADQLRSLYTEWCSFTRRTTSPRTLIKYPERERRFISTAQNWSIH